MPRSDPEYDACQDTSEHLVAAYRSEIEQDDCSTSLAVVHYRGTAHELTLGLRYCASPDPLDRVTGAIVLAQLGWGDRMFISETVPALIALLSDPVDRVVAAAAIALGHRADPACIPHVEPLIDHPNPDVRFGVVGALSGHDDPRAVAGLIRLSRDPDNEVRDWAAFGLGSQTEIDSPPLRDALADLLADPDPEIRGEALIGLARRRDRRGYEPLIAELRGEYHGSWCLEAVELWADQTLLSHLKELRTRIDDEGYRKFEADFAKAESACTAQGASQAEESGGCRP